MLLEFGSDSISSLKTFSLVLEAFDHRTIQLLLNRHKVFFTFFTTDSDLKNFARFQDSFLQRKATHCCDIRGATSGSVPDLAYVTARNPGRGSLPLRLEFYSNHSKGSSDRCPPHSGQPRPTSAESSFGIPNNRHCPCICTLRAERDVRVNHGK